LKTLWIGTNGETAIISKDEGCGIMISAFQCREVGFGLALTADELDAKSNFFRITKKLLILESRISFSVKRHLCATCCQL
jgi:hypothetical protein